LGIAPLSHFFLPRMRLQQPRPTRPARQVGRARPGRSPHACASSGRHEAEKETTTSPKTIRASTGRGGAETTPSPKTTRPGPSPLPVPDSPPSSPRLTNPVRITAAASRTHTLVTTPLPAPGSLDAYMALPPVSYDAVDRALIKPLPGAPPGTFTLAVPRAGILGVWVEPAVDVVVRTPSPGDRDPRVVISSVGTSRLKGSPAVEALRLRDRFSLAFTAELAWEDSPPGGRPSSISASTRVTVWAEPLGPFALLPRSALTTAGDALLAGLSSALLPTFLRRLAADYEEWAGSAAMRAARSARAVAAGHSDAGGGPAPPPV